MTTTGLVIAGVGSNVDDGSGGQAWVNPDRITADDGSNSTTNMASASTTQWLVSSSHDFSSIPDGATINGITVRIQRWKQSDNFAFVDNIVQLTKNGTSVVGGNKASATPWTTTANENIDYGGSADLWGTTWTAAEVKASTFGLVLKGDKTSGGGGSSNTRVDAIWIGIDYTEPAAGGKRRKTLLGVGH